LREAVTGRLPESVRTRRKTPLVGSPLVEQLRKSQTGWMGRVEWNVAMDSYVNRSAMPALQAQTNLAKAQSSLRPLCLNFWLQSARKVRYNLRAEVRNA